MKEDKTIPKGKWEFNQEVTDVFENMLERSIPQYEIMRKSVTNIIKGYTDKNHSGQITILDIGCSEGGAISALVPLYPNSRFFGIEISDSMLSSAKKKFMYDTNVKIMKKDLRNINESEIPNSQVILSILTLQFVPIEYRQELLQKLYNAIPGKGIFILVEKVLGNSADINKLLVEQYYNLKAKNGYTLEEIERKKLSLEGVLVPTTAKWNEDLLRQVGFRQVDCFWRWMNFSGWIAIK